MKRKSLSYVLLIFVLSLSFVISGCGDKEQDKNQNDKNTIEENNESGKVQVVKDEIDDNYRVFYEIFVGSFSDSNGDGTGDLRGIIDRLDYLNDGNANSETSLGIQGIWLSPVFASPSYHKYDCSDYYKIDPKFGTMEELKELIDECHKRNVKVILDLVLNHTSNSNLWFTKFANAHKDNDITSEYYRYYSFATGNERQSGHTYSRIPGCADEYYECNFSTDMPELDYDNVNVKLAALDVAKYYLDLGVDGFRFDAVKYIYYGDTPKSAKFWEWYMEELRKIKPDIYCVGECWSGDGEVLEYVSAMNCFNFSMSQAEGYIANAVKGTGMSVFTNYVENYSKKVAAANPEYGMMTSFISNHDMDRAAGYLTLANRRMYGGANLLILSPGSPFIYYGEEIGMKGSRGAANTDANRRLGMVWGDDDTIGDPIGTTYERSKQTNGTVESHLSDETSLLHHYRKLIDLRNSCPAIARGEYKSLDYGEKKVGGFLISYMGEEVVLIHNVSETEKTIDLTIAGLTNSQFDEIVGYVGVGEASLDGNMLTIGEFTSIILK